MARAEVPVAVYGPPDAGAVAQLHTCVSHGDAVAGALMADHHIGYSQPIGGVVAYENHVSPSGAGYDIGCGVKAVRTDLRAQDVPIGPVMDQIVRRISFGVGRESDERVDHPVLDRIRDAPFEPQRDLADLAAAQLGTVGSGNHYVDLLEDEEGALWVATHFGSRGFGHRTASGFLSLAAGGRFGQPGRDGEMNSPPVLLDVREGLGQAYVEAMTLAGEYAYAGRDVVVDKVLGILGATITHSVHNHHNFIWRETHAGRDVWVVRKGATPAFPGQQGFVGGSMGDIAVVVEGVEHPEAERALYSTVHGAGRVMSRTQAAGKWTKRFVCPVRGCGREIGTGRKGRPAGRCPEHAHVPPRRIRVRGGGLIDWERVRAELRERGLELRGAGPDEAPGVYKRLADVVAAHSDHVKVVHTLRPLGVAMACPDTFDPYKD
jgi:tRNA-splicing ligase RtcB